MVNEGFRVNLRAGYFRCRCVSSAAVSTRTDSRLRPGYPERMTEIEPAVYRAPAWLEAKEEMLAADRGREDPAATELAFDSAEFELAKVVYRLLGREPRLP